MDEQELNKEIQPDQVKITNNNFWCSGRNNELDKTKNIEVQANFNRILPFNY